MSATIQAGAAVLDLAPAVGLPMGGYGARVGVSIGVHDPIRVRTLVLHDGETTLALAVCDLVGVTAALVNAARAIIEAESGIPAANVCISATHTHSGPLPTADQRGAWLEVTARQIAGSVAAALRALRPVTLKLATTTVTTISQNRRDPAGPIETTATVLLAAPEAGGPPVATVVNYACHATVLEHDNLLYSADFPGAMARAVEQAAGGVAIYMQGAAGAINPVWMRHDFDEVARIGGILGAAAARTVHELRPLGEGQWAVNLSWNEQSPAPPAPGAVLSEARLRAAQRMLEVPRRALLSAEAISAEMELIEAELGTLAPEDTAGRRALRQRLNQLRMDRAQAINDPSAEGQSESIELQAFRLSDECAVVMLPGEFFVEIARAIEAAAGVPHLLLCGYANATIGYVPNEAAFPHGGYEAGRARFVQDADARIIEAAAALVRSLYE